MKPTRITIATSLLLTALCAAQATRAQADEVTVLSDVWSEPNPGIRYLRRRTSRPAVIHAVVVDLTVSGVRIEATRREHRWSTVTEYAEREQAAVAMNGGFWSSFAFPYGLQVGHGEVWPNGDEDGETGAFVITQDGRAIIRRPNGTRMGNRGYRTAVSGIPLLVWRGHVQSRAIDEIGAASRLHPRTAIGVSRDGRTVYMAVVDGRRHGSRGLNLYHLAAFMKELGAYRALNLDGGGSSTMFVRSAGGIVSAPSGGRWESRFGFGAEEAVEATPGEAGETGALPAPPTKTRRLRNGERQIFVRGVEREVMNHLGVFAPPHAVAPAASTGDDAMSESPTPPSAEPEVVLPPREVPWRFGRLREHLRWALPAGAVLSLLLIGWRLRRRRLLTR